jgi:catechol 2,3-dioxygenase-like lactoylglutathione lyase family enzyme
MAETQSRTTHITQVGRVIVTVADQDKAIAFYVDKLGFEKRADVPFGNGDRWVEVGPPGGTATIALVPPMGGGEAQPTHTGIVLDSDDVAADHAELQARGVDVDAQILSGPDIPSMFWFRDRDGNTLMIVAAA